eukprot:5555202-Amphidinium_carterae.1
MALQKKKFVGGVVVADLARVCCKLKHNPEQETSTHRHPRSIPKSLPSYLVLSSRLKMCVPWRLARGAMRGAFHPAGPGLLGHHAEVVFIRETRWQTSSCADAPDSDIGTAMGAPLARHSPKLNPDCEQKTVGALEVTRVAAGSAHSALVAPERLYASCGRCRDKQA